MVHRKDAFLETMAHYWKGTKSTSVLYFPKLTLKGLFLRFLVLVIC